MRDESSPYLLQHADNPVDWFPWGTDAFARAREADKPVLLSVGYAACHWCHVMAHESFEDPVTAKLMNEHFVCVKVDREERPDVDSVYMDAVQAMTGHGGWPMTVFLTPQGTPFYGGTYFPPDDRHGLPSFRRLLEAVAETWRERRDEIESQGDRLLEHVADLTRFEPAPGDLDPRLVGHALDGLKGTFDPAYGGFGGPPKFPQPMVIDLLLALASEGSAEAGDMAVRTLDAMAAGGIFDQLGGGFHRYSVDRMWTVPHFEKMLYDNAQLLRTYARSWLVHGSSRHREVAEATADWLLREMRDPAGGFWSSLDADSEGEEGRFYVWSLEEAREASGPDASVALGALGMTEHGNFEGANIPVHASEPSDPDAFERARLALLERRSQRVRPETDTKVLAGWNALTAAALAEAGATLGHPAWVQVAQEVMGFVATSLRPEGRLMRSYRRVDGRDVVTALGCCEDYAFFLEACLALYEATFEQRWLDEARWAADEGLRLFRDQEAGGFYTTGSDADDLPVRPKDLFDNAVPSGNSTMALGLQRLAELTGVASYVEAAGGALRPIARAAQSSPIGFGLGLSAIHFYTAGAREIVIVGTLGTPDTEALVATVRTLHVANKVLVVSDDPEAEASKIPLLRDRSTTDGRATAYVCRRGVCDRPVTDPKDLAEQLAAP
ncbi:MAG TPA: thioredoxin domain-containing protein [Actinomycetota bacterium]|nr:thioredoxin domain-containing protein [Actinomycetota bacterium]